MFDLALFSLFSPFFPCFIFQSISAFLVIIRHHVFLSLARGPCDEVVFYSGAKRRENGDFACLRVLGPSLAKAEKRQRLCFHALMLEKKTEMEWMGNGNA